MLPRCSPRLHTADPSFRCIPTPDLQAPPPASPTPHVCNIKCSVLLLLLLLLLLSLLLLLP